MTTASFASPVDAFAFGAHPIFGPGRARSPVRRFTDRLDSTSTDGRRYHLYGGWSCPRSHRAAVVIALRGLGELVTVSYLDGLRDGRGWAFRPRTGPDPVNGFSLLRQAYAASEPDYRGEISLPVLWDRRYDRILSNDPDGIDLDLATAFPQLGPSLHSAADTEQLTAISGEVSRLERTIVRAVYHQADRADLQQQLGNLERRLAGRRFLLGDRLTLADVRLWVVLVRYDVGPNAHGAAGPRLSSYAHIADYARRLHQLPAFRDTTNISAFAAPMAPRPDWLDVGTRSAPVSRPTVAGSGPRLGRLVPGSLEGLAE